MLRLIALALLLLPSSALAADDDFTSLFDGKTLDGWEGDTKIFRVRDGAIVAGSLDERIAHNQFLCTTREYGDFELRLKAKLVGQGHNAGVQFRSQRVPDHYEVSGYQCDIGQTAERPIWGSLYDESRRNRFLADGDAAKLRKAIKPGDWNDITVRAEGNHIQIWVNDLQTVDYREMDKDVARKGIIGLQIHGGAPSEASYKDLKIRELK